MTRLDVVGNWSRKAVLQVVEEFKEAAGSFDARSLAWHMSGNLLPAFAFPGLRAQVFRSLGFKIGNRTCLLGSLRIVGPANAAKRLRIGAGCVVGPGVTFGLDGDISIGENVAISPGVTFSTASHALGRRKRRMSFSILPMPIVVGNGVWIGMDALVLPGVTIGDGSVIAAGSVVFKDIPPNVLASGNPATVIKKLSL